MDDKRFARLFDKSIWPAHLEHGRPSMENIKIFDGTRPTADIATEVQALVEPVLKRKTIVKSKVVKTALQKDLPVDEGREARPKVIAKAATRQTRRQGEGTVLDRIYKAQESAERVCMRSSSSVQKEKVSSFKRALQEIRNGRKSGHWIWYVWPALASLRPGTSRPEFLLPDLLAVQAFLQHEVLRERFIEITEVAIEHLQRGVAPKTLFGSATDADKFVECLTVFAYASISSKDDQMQQLCASGLNAAQGGRLHDRAVEVLSLRAKNIKHLYQNT